MKIRSVRDRLLSSPGLIGSGADFFNYISLDNSGTYLNGYMLVDSKTNETGLGGKHF